MEEEARMGIIEEELEPVVEGLTQDSDRDVAVVDVPFEMDDDEFTAMVGVREYESSSGRPCASYPSSSGYAMLDYLT